MSSVWSVGDSLSDPFNAEIAKGAEEGVESFRVLGTAILQHPRGPRRMPRQVGLKRLRRRKSESDGKARVVFFGNEDRASKVPSLVRRVLSLLWPLPPWFEFGCSSAALPWSKAAVS